MFPPGKSRISAFAALLLCLLVAGACSRTFRTDLHWERARDLMLKAETLADGQPPDYADPIWLEVIEELSQVHPDFERSEEALALLEEIKASRAAAFKDGGGKKEEEIELPPIIDVSGRDDGDGGARSDPFVPDGYVGPDLSGQGRWDLTLQDLTTRRGEGRFVLAGRIRNISGREITNAMILVEFLGPSGRIVRFQQAMVDPGRVLAGGYGRFEVDTTDSAELSSYKIRFRELGGSELKVRTAEAESLMP
jgi:hypothetical protein